ncbi:MAG: SdrD B-like domain-containing protein [Fimbriiglobus sp.]
MDSFLPLELRNYRKPGTPAKSATAQIRLENLEDRSVPSSSIQLTGLGFKPLGPGVVTGTSAANPTLTNAGRVNGISVSPIPFDSANPGFTGPTDPTDPTFELWNTYFVATPGGGVARTKDSGQSWQFLTDNMPTSSWGNNDLNRNLHIGSVEVSPLNRNLVFAGTGDPFGGIYGFAGRGLLRSLDNGETWTLNKGPSNAFDGAAFKKFVFHPTDANVIFAVVEGGGLSNYSTGARLSAVYRTINGGNTWDSITPNTGGADQLGNLLPTSGINPVTDFILDPTSPNVGYVALQNYGVLRTNSLQTGTGSLATYNVPASGQWSIVLGGTGTQLPGGSFGQIRLAFGLGTPSQPSRIYAMSTSQAGTANQLFRSDDSGINFRRLDPFPGNIAGANGIYNLTLVADPTTPNRLYVGGRGASSIQVLTNADYEPNNPNVTPNWVNLTLPPSIGDVYTTVRDIKFDNTGAKDINGRPVNPGRLLIATDSGVYRLEAPEGAVTTNTNFINNNLVLTNLNGRIGTGALAIQQVFATGLSPRDDNRAISGTYLNGTAVFQDNGPFLPTDPGYQGIYGWGPTTGPESRGSGGNVVFNQLDPNRVFRVSNTQGSTFPTAFGGLFQRSTDGGNSWATSTTGIVRPGSTFTIVPFEVNPSPLVGTLNADMVLGTDVVNRSSDDGQSWSQYWSDIRWVSNTGSRVSTLAVGRVPFNSFGDTYPVYVASNSRTGTVSVNGAAMYRTIIGPNGERWWLDITPGNPTGPFIIDTFTGTEPPSNNLTPLGLGGVITDIAVDPTDSEIVYVTIDSPGAVVPQRVFRSITGGVTWTDITGNLPAAGAAAPGLRVYSVALDPNRLIIQPGNPNSPAFQEDDDVYIGTSIGVYKLTDPTSATPTWTRLFGTAGGFGATGTDQVSGQLPDAMVRDVRVNTTTGLLSVSTFGRGVWQTQIRPYIRGLVYDDLSGNGVRDVNPDPLLTDNKLGGAVVVANDVVPNPPVQFANATANANGEWVFRSLPDSNYEFIPANASTQYVDPLTKYYFTSVPILTPMDETKTINGQDLFLFRRVTVGGKVYEDANGNGLFDPGENPAVGFTVSLIAPAGTLDAKNPTLISTTTTDVNGNYTFFGVGPLRPDAVGPSTPFAAGYQVTVAKSGYQITDDTKSTGPLTSGKNLDDVNNEANTRLGVFRFGQLSGVVFGDTNGDGALNGLEAGKSGWTVELYNATNNTLVLSTVTDVNGAYLFGDLSKTLQAGSYDIRLIDKAGFVQTTGTLATQNVISGTNTKGQNIGVFKAASISGTAFEDLNGDGIRQVNETTNIPGVTITVIDPRNNAAVGSAVTDGSGNYTINNLFPLATPGNTTPFLVRFTDPAGVYAQTILDPAVTVSSDTTSGPVNIPLFIRTTVSGSAFEDINGNGIQDAGEGGLVGGSVSLLNSATGAVVFTTTTDANGDFQFTGVGPIVGPIAYRIGANPVGFVQTTPNPADFLLTSNTPVTGLSLGLFRLATFSGLVFDDLNGNGVFDSGEPGLAGRTIQLIDTNSSSVVSTVFSSGDGTYIIQAGAGSFTTRLVPTPGFAQTTPNPVNTLTRSGLNVTNQDFGSFQLTTVTGRVFNDINGNSLLDSEPGVGNWRIELVDSNGSVVQSTTTDNTGFFVMTGVGPGNYTLRQVLQTGWSPSTPAAQSFTAFSGTPSTFQFGIFRPTTVSGNVYEDLDRSNTFTGGDIASSGWTVQLVRPGGIVFGTFVTDASGNFSINNVPPGNYTVRVLNRQGWTILNNGNQSVVITSGTPVTVNRVGVLKLGSIAGSVFLDTNRNNTRDSFERGLPDAILAILDQNGTQLTTVTTDANGNYTFFGLQNGTYSVRLLTSPAGFTSTGVTGNRTVAVTIGSTTPNNSVTNVNFGLLGRKRYATAADGNGGPRVQVYDAVSNSLLQDFFVYEVTFTGGVRVASADVTGDGIDDLVVVPGKGGGPRVRVLNGVDGAEVYNYFSYEPSFVDGLYVAAGDVDGDGFADIVTGTSPGGGPRVTVFSGRTGVIIADYFAFDSDFTGGVRVGVGDTNGDGIAEIFTAQGPGGNNTVRVWGGGTFRLLTQFDALGQPDYTGGLYVSGSVAGLNGISDIIVGTGVAFPTPSIRIFDGRSQGLKAELEAFPSSDAAFPYSSEVRAIGIDRNGDNVPDLAIASGPGSPPRLRFVDGLNYRQIGDELQPFEIGFLGGIFIG